MTISEKLHKIKNDLRKKNSSKYLDRHIPELFKLEKDIRRNVIKAIKNPRHELHFNSGDLRIICTTIRTKVNKIQASLYYEGVQKSFEQHDIINDDVFNKVMAEAKELHLLLQKLYDLHYLYGTITATTQLVENMQKRS